MPVLKLIFSKDLEIFSRRLRNTDRIDYTLSHRQTIKDVIESVGVPHTEVGRITVRQQAVDFRCIPVQSSTVSISPIVPPFDVTRPSTLRPQPLRTYRYLVDVNVGKLAGLMRMIGLDTAYNRNDGDDEIARRAEKENRIVLSRDIGLLKRRQIAYGRFIRADYPQDQLKEVIDFFGLAERLHPFSRCLRCNSALVSVDKKKINHRLEPKTRTYFYRFKQCPACDQIYWRGSHHGHMQKRLQEAGWVKSRTG